MPPLSVMIKPSSGNCNMSCAYCFYCDEMRNRTQPSYGFMTEETLKNVIRRTLLRAEGHISYAFQGGEPTLRGLDFFRKVMEYQRLYNRRGIQVSNAFQTNGYALDDDWCSFFAQHRFLVGISVDGTKEIHDSLRRGRGDMGPTFDRVDAAAGLLEKHGVEYNILTVVTRQVAENIKEIYRFYDKKGWRYQQYIECLDPLEKEWGQEPHSLTPEAYGRFLIDLFTLWHEDWRRGRMPYNRKFENYVAILLGRMPESCEQRGVCGMQMVVEADGSVYPCDFYVMDRYRLGNFNTDRVDHIDAKRREIAFVEESGKVSQVCRNCGYYRVCRGGCQRSKLFYPEEKGYRSYFCEGYRMFFRECLGRLQEMADWVEKGADKRKHSESGKPRR